MSLCPLGNTTLNAAGAALYPSGRTTVLDSLIVPLAKNTGEYDGGAMFPFLTLNVPTALPLLS